MVLVQLGVEWARKPEWDKFNEVSNESSGHFNPTPPSLKSLQVYITYILPLWLLSTISIVFDVVTTFTFKKLFVSRFARQKI